MDLVLGTLPVDLAPPPVERRRGKAEAEAPPRDWRQSFVVHGPPPRSRRVGRCLSAAPDTDPDFRISAAFAIASSSSVRSCCRLSKSDDAMSHSDVSVARYVSSSALAF